jgi:CheY-like chemotaxis protein
LAGDGDAFSQRGSVWGFKGGTNFVIGPFTSLVQGRLVLLIVEDDAELRELYRVTFEAEFRVHACADGFSALQFIEQQPPDVILLDLNLQYVSGLDVYAELRSHAATHDIPIVICTGSDVFTEFPDARLVRKPCTPEALLDAVHDVLAKSKPIHGLGARIGPTQP